jgi:FixJ family two-component response regulator
MATRAAPKKVVRLSRMPLVAVVDDDEAVRDALCDLLFVEGFEARPFASGMPFLSDSMTQTYDCLITDVRMPDIDGLELQRRLRSRGARIPVIFITSSNDKRERDQAFRSGAMAWFSKPVSDEALLEALRRATGERNQSDVDDGSRN